VSRRRKNKKYCKICRKDLSRGQYGFHFCSKRHYDRHTYQEYVKDWLAGRNSGGGKGRVSKHVRRWLYEHRGRKCEHCGWDEPNPASGHIPVEINHIDGDKSNHRPENLEILCPNCHSLTPTYGSLNRPNRSADKADTDEVT
jgi:5-methylcytosine-specific restriction endonuclease McrA